jgi:NADH dehydrogenase [ubiquinone] 1 alpha subcomplex assembly factor 5
LCHISKMSEKAQMSSEIFDRQVVKIHRDRAARGLSEFEFLLCEVADMVADRLSDIRRSFPVALDVGCHTGQIAALLAGRGGIETLLQCDLSEQMARRTSGLKIVADEEYLPIGDGVLDLVVSCLSLHWVNDLPGALIQLRRALKEDGLFLAAFFGGETLKELRQSLIAAESEITGGAGPRVSPYADVRDGGALLQRAGFALPVADTDVLTVSYESPLKLMRDLRGMGEQMATHTRQKSFTRRSIMLRAAEIYQEMFGDSDGRVPATFEIITLTAWSPSASQQQPLTRGTGQVNLADVLNPKERGE